MTTVKYDMSKNYFKCYNETQGVMVKKKQILKQENKKVFGYLEHGLILLIYVVLISISSKVVWFMDKASIFSKVLTIVEAIAFLLITIYYISFIFCYLYESKKIHKGKLIIDEDGITDISESKVKVGLPWENILGVVTTKNALTIVTDKPVYFFVGNNEKEKLIKAILKYKEDILIIEK